MHLDIGKQGEDIAVAYLQKHNYAILARNEFYRIGEIDIVCRIKNTIVFVEVKTRVGTSAGEPHEAVSGHKRYMLHKLGEIYANDHKLHRHPLRADVIAIELHTDLTVKRLKHYKSVDI